MKALAPLPQLLAVIGFVLVCSNGYAATERIVDYEYDGAGNIVRIITQEQSDPPAVSPLSPGFVNQGQSRTVTTTGSNLLGADVSTDSPGLSIDVIQTEITQISFQLTAASDALVGNAIIRFSTSLGEVQQSIVVAEVSPAITTNPSPIIIDTGGTSNSITLSFSVPRSENETFSLSVVDPTIATVDSASFNILSGQTGADISLTGIAVGTTALQVDLPEKFYSYRFPVYVSETYAELLQSFSDMAERNLFAEAVGVLVGSNSGTHTKPVGVFYGDANRGGLLSKPVGVIVSSTISYTYNAPVGTIYGPYLTGSQPLAIGIGTTTNVEASGFNLGEVVTIKLEPADDIDVGSISINPEGTLLTVSITVDPLAVTGSRELNLEDANGPITIGPSIPLTLEIQ